MIKITTPRKINRSASSNTTRNSRRTVIYIYITVRRELIYIYIILKNYANFL